jgi:hypothetical protein
LFLFSSLKLLLLFLQEGFGSVFLAEGSHGFAELGVGMDELDFGARACGFSRRHRGRRLLLIEKCRDWWWCCSLSGCGR